MSTIEYQLDPFIKVLDSLEVILDNNPGDVFEAAEIIGKNLRQECLACGLRGQLALAKVILDHANTAS